MCEILVGMYIAVILNQLKDTLTSKVACRWIRLFNSLIQRHNVVGYVCSTR